VKILLTAEFFAERLVGPGDVVGRAGE